jgi:Flp pilus assembly protein TadD
MITSHRRRRLLGAALLLVVAALAGGLGWHGWRWYRAPVPPEISLADTDPEVADAVRKALDRVRHDPYSVPAWGGLAMLLRATDFWAAATVCFQQTAQLDPQNPRWPYLEGEALLQRGDADAALPLLRRAVDLSDPDSEQGFAPQLRLAEVLLAAGRYDEAEPFLRRLLQSAPDDPAVHLDLGILDYARGRLTESSDLLLRCLHSPFTRKRACAQLAAVRQRQGQRAEAEQFSRRSSALPADVHWVDPWVLECLRLAPGKSARFRYVERLEAQGRFREAVQELEHLQPDGPDYKVLIGLGKDRARLGDLVGSEKALREALRLRPDSVQAHYYLSNLLWNRAEQKAKEQDGQEAAQALFRAAADEAERALKNKPDHALANMLLGLCLEKLGKRTKARAALRKAVECGPELAEPAFQLGKVLAAEGNVVEARRYLEWARQRAGPDDPRPAAALARLPDGSKE